MLADQMNAVVRLTASCQLVTMLKSGVTNSQVFCTCSLCRCTSADDFSISWLAGIIFY